ncbi:MAG: GMC oxidoreductase [Gemmatimonadetes bacterium]|nr:GMC oxidoreductase [Gemmatimonadota bacterium]
MTRLDNEFQHDADVIVIGSGFGGSVAASRLVDAGRSVLLLERGPWRDTVPVREAGITNTRPLPRNGGITSVIRSLHPPFGPKRGIRLNRSGFLDLWIGQGVKAVCTSGMGGGSHIWAAMLEQPPEGFWNGRAAGLSDDVLAGHYDRTLQELKGVQPPDPARVPNHTDHAWAGEDYFTPLGPGEQPPMAVLYPEQDSAPQPQTDEHGIVRMPMDFHKEHGMFGSPDGSKSTVDALYLLPAMQKGLAVRPMHEVRAIFRQGNGGYRVKVHDLDKRRDLFFSAPEVVLAAGTMNTNHVLLHSCRKGGLDALPELGKGFGANGDLIGSWPVPEDGSRDSVLGPPVHGRVRIKGHEDSAYVILAAGDTPPVPGFLYAKARAKAGRAFDVVAMSQDAADGLVRMDKGRMKFSFSMDGSPSYAATMRAFEALGELSGRPLRFDAGSVMTAHPMGGCRISDDATAGVVDGAGQVHGCPGLYIADASVFPQPVGVPPSLSIAAWASHVAGRMTG